MKILTAITHAKAALPRLDVNKNGTVTTAETSQGLKAGKVTAAEAKLLQRVASDIRQGMTVPNYLAELDLYEAAAHAADTNHDGVLSKAEARVAPNSFTDAHGKTVWNSRAMLKKLAAF